MLHKTFGQYGYKIVRKELAFCTFKIGSIFIKEAALIKPLWGKTWSVDNKQSIEELGIDYIPAQQSLDDMIPSMIEHGYLPDKKNKKKK